MYPNVRFPTFVLLAPPGNCCYSSSNPIFGGNIVIYIIVLILHIPFHCRTVKSKFDYFVKTAFFGPVKIGEDP